MNISLKKLPGASPLYSLILLSLFLLFFWGCETSNGSTNTENNGTFAKAEANIGSWTFIPVKGAICRDGSPTGIGIRLQKNAKNLMIYLRGGGACWDGRTCDNNRDSFDAKSFRHFASRNGNKGIFKKSGENPVEGWNMVFIPYCTGDLHAGSARDVSIQGVKELQQFTGAQNIRYDLEILAPYFKNSSKVLISGTSAGGFGALLTFYKFATAFDHSKMYLLDDSGPIFFSNKLFSPAFQQHLISLWNMDKPFPKNATMLSGPDGLPKIYQYYDKNYPNATFGLVSFTQDKTIRFYLSHGQHLQPEISGKEYYSGLLDMRSKLGAHWGTYYRAGNDHTMIQTSRFFFDSTGTTPLYGWLSKLLNGVPETVGP